jgi:hypothetical protein
MQRYKSTYYLFNTWEQHAGAMYMQFTLLLLFRPCLNPPPPKKQTLFFRARCKYLLGTSREGMASTLGVFDDLDQLTAYAHLSAVRPSWPWAVAR